MRNVALTGTPGTGKSAAARLLAAEWPVEEVADLAERVGAVVRSGSGPRRTRVIDIDAMRRAILRDDRTEPRLWVGHLAHLLPVREAVVLRCHPRELAERLGRRRPHRPRDVRENLLAEATDVILVEAVALRRRVWEVDTTARTPAEVARAVAVRLRRRGPPSYGRVDWLADPWVTEHLLEWSR